MYLIIHSQNFSMPVHLANDVEAQLTFAACSQHKLHANSLTGHIIFFPVFSEICFLSYFALSISLTRRIICKPQICA